jgi:hypothetical protein
MWRVFVGWGPLFLFTVWFTLETFWRDQWLSKISAPVWTKLYPARLYVWFQWCILYTWVWRTQFKARQSLASNGLSVIFVLSIIVVVEAVLDLLKVPALAIHIPLWVDRIALILAVLLAIHHFHEWKLARREMEVPRILEGVLVKCRSYFQVILPLAPDEQRKYFCILMDEFKTLLEIEAKGKITLALMKATNGGELCTIFASPPTSPVNRELKFAKGHGAAGKAYQENTMIYVPSTRHRVGIKVDTFLPVGLAYILSGTEGTFRSLLCVPVVPSPTAFLVINVLSGKRRAFSQLDFDIAQLAAAFIGMAYSGWPVDAC